jgi:hypothetical protein
MRKLYQKEKWKKHSRAVQRKILRKSRKKSQKHGSDIIPAQKRKSHKPIFVVAPVNYSLLDNTEEMLVFYDKINDLAKTGHRVFLDLRGVRNITYDALLYTLSLIDYFNAKYEPFYIEGNQPLDAQCAKIFNESGFNKFVNTRTFTWPNIDVLSIERGESTEPVIAAEVKKFSADHLKASSSQDMKSQNLYNTLVECMNNTVGHAYKDVSRSLKPKWWIICYFDKLKGRVVFTFLDNGSGIPSTVRKNFLERVPSNTADGKLIVSALNGEFRSETRKKNRGLGLPEIYSYQKEKQIEDLVIISNKAKVVVGDDMKVTNLENKFHGTLLSWSYR